MTRFFQQSEREKGRMKTFKGGGAAQRRVALRWMEVAFDNEREINHHLNKYCSKIHAIQYSAIELKSSFIFSRLGTFSRALFR